MIKTEYKITFKIKTGYYLELLTPETVKLLGRTKSKITKDRNGENVPHLEITEVKLVHWKVVNKLSLCSKWAILSIARNFTNKLYLFKKS